MIRSKNILYVFWLLSIVAALCTTVLRTTAMVCSYDMNSGYFNNGSVLPTVLYITVAAFVIAFLFFAFKLRRCKLPSAFQLSSASVFSSVFMGTIFSIIFIFYVISAKAGSSALGLIMTMLSFFSAVYFFFDFVIIKRSNTKTNDMKAVLGLFLAFWYLALMLSIYFDKSLPTNSPTKNYAYLTLISVILFIIYECHTFLGKTQGALYLSVGFICTAFSTSLSVPHIVCANMSQKPFIISVVYDFAILAIGIYSAIRTFVFIKNVTSEDKTQK